MGKYSKFVAALGTAFVEGVALWANAPSWVVALAGFIGAAVVYQVPNAGNSSATAEASAFAQGASASSAGA